MPSASDNINVTTVYLLLGELKEQVNAGFTGVNARLDKLNGRVAKGEKDHGELNVRVALLEDRQDSTTKSRIKTGGMMAALIGAVEIGRQLLSLWRG